jgi:Cof subfamily protein (haloacid dehalogenase superfamily)
MVPVIKLFITDIDHTLFSPERGIPQANIDALIDLQRTGVKVAIATGRVHPGVFDIIKQLQLDVYGGYAITSNGGLTTSAQSGSIIHQATIPLDELKVLVDLAETWGLDLAVEQQGIVLYQGPAESVAYDRDVVKVRVKAVKHLGNELSMGAHKLEVKQAPHRNGQALDQFIAALPVRYSICRGHPTYMELMAQGISKASGLEALCRLQGISPQETAAIGDGINDLELLSAAGLSAAPINARPQVKNVVDHIVPHVNEAGLAVFVRHILEENQRHR